MIPIELIRLCAVSFLFGAVVMYVLFRNCILPSIIEDLKE